MKKDLNKITDINSYLKELAKYKDYLVLISFKDTIGLAFDENLQKLIMGLGLQTNLVGQHQHGYVAIINNGNVAYEKICNEDSFIQYKFTLGSIDIEVCSMPYTCGNKASVAIGSVQCSVNSRGINIVVFDASYLKVIDSVCFDTHLKTYSCNRIDLSNIAPVLFTNKSYDSAQNRIMLDMLLDIQRKVTNNLNITRTIKTDTEDIVKKDSIRDAHNEIKYWNLYKNLDEDWANAKKRFFLDIPKLPKESIGRKEQLASDHLLIELDKICKANNITYWICFGTLLGAVRHKGFIPWDDDVDVCMPRADFIKFQKVMENNADYFVDRGFYYPANWTAQFKYLDCKTHKLNFSVDIFIMDYAEDCSEENWNRLCDIRKEFVVECQKIFGTEATPTKTRIPAKFYPELEKIFSKYYKKVEKDCGITAKPNKSFLWGLENTNLYSYTHFCNRNVADMFPFEEVEFEGNKYLAPKNAEQYLNVIFGDIYSLPDDIISHKHFAFDEAAVEGIEFVVNKYKIELK